MNDIMHEKAAEERYEHVKEVACVFCKTHKQTTAFLKQ